MDTNELEVKLQFGHETTTFEVKDRMDWNTAALVKDFLAMSNNRDGGDIVIGVHDGDFARTGVDDATKATYKFDDMRDQLKRFADPPMRFSVATVADVNGTEYIAITIAPFDRFPIICQCDNGVLDTVGMQISKVRARKIKSDAVFAGEIYYRNSNMKIESAAISNAQDMLELVMTSINRSAAWFKERGFVQVATEEFLEQLDNELEGL